VLPGKLTHYGTFPLLFSTEYDNYNPGYCSWSAPDQSEGGANFNLTSSGISRLRTPVQISEIHPSVFSRTYTLTSHWISSYLLCPQAITHSCRKKGEGVPQSLTKIPSITYQFNHPAIQQRAPATRQHPAKLPVPMDLAKEHS